MNSMILNMHGFCCLDMACDAFDNGLHTLHKNHYFHRPFFNKRIKVLMDECFGGFRGLDSVGVKPLVVTPATRG